MSEITKNINKNINYFIIDDKYDLIKNHFNIIKYDRFYSDFTEILKDKDIVVDNGDYFIYFGSVDYNDNLKKHGHKQIKKLILKKNKIYPIENNYPSNSFCLDESGEKYDIMNIWHDICLFSEHKKQLERKIKLKTIL